MKTTELRGADLITAKRRASCLIGIDPGTHTGIAIKESGLFRIIETMTIFEALNLTHEWFEYHKGNTLVRIEDARKRTWFGKSKKVDVFGNLSYVETGRERLKGAGSVSRDCAIWEETLTKLKIPFELVHPKQVKATTAEQFKLLTGWAVRTSIHAREAAWLVI